MFNKDGSINTSYNSKNSILKYKPNAEKEINKIINCHNKNRGFYVYAEKKKFKNMKSGVEYVTRYCGRVAISENRILNYDG